MRFRTKLLVFYLGFRTKINDPIVKTQVRRFQVKATDAEKSTEGGLWSDLP